MGRNKREDVEGSIFKGKEGWECVGTHAGCAQGQCGRCLSHSSTNKIRLTQCGCTHKQDIFGIKISPDVYQFY